MSSICNPPIPYETPISVQPGLSVTINGTSTGETFFVDFQSGPGPSSDIAFRFQSKFAPHFHIAGNSRVNGVWGPEQKLGAHFPLTHGYPFQIMILADVAMFKVAVNGAHFAEFGHRMPLSVATFLSIRGSVAVSQLSWTGGAMPYQSPVNQPYGMAPGMPYPQPTAPAANPTCTLVPAMPYPQPAAAPTNPTYVETSPAKEHMENMSKSMGNMFSGFMNMASAGMASAVKNSSMHSYQNTGMSFGGPPQSQHCHVSTTVKHSNSPFDEPPVLNPSIGVPHEIPYLNMAMHKAIICGVPGMGRFNVDFTDKKQRDVLFHFNPRLEDGVIVRNSLLKGLWGKEERSASGGMPFIPGVPFQMEVKVSLRNYTVIVNGAFACEYKHRGTFVSDVKYIKFGGSVRITSLVFE